MHRRLSATADSRYSFVCLLKPKFHYASWFEPVCDQVRTSFEPASVMEFGFKGLAERLWREQGSVWTVKTNESQRTTDACQPLDGHRPAVQCQLITDLPSST